MRYSSALLMWLLTTSVAFAGAEPDVLKLRLDSPKRFQLVGELWDLRLAIVNVGDTPVHVEPGFLTVHLELEQPDQPIACYPPHIVTPGVRELQWQQIDPGKELTVPITHYQCRERSQAGTPTSDWWETAGEYTFRASASHLVVAHEVERSGSFPGNSGNWELQGEPLTISVRQPSGIDAEALQWARENGYRAASFEVANEFRSSYYSALVVRELLTVRGGTPAEIILNIEKGIYPGRDVVPDALSPDGRRVINRGAEMARWRIEQGTRVLHEQESFPYERDVQLSVALSYVALGERANAESILKDVAAEENTVEGEWAQEFLNRLGPAKY